MRFARFAALAALAAAPALAQTSPAPNPAPSIVAAENFYGDVAQQIAGPGVAVSSILSNPDEDPHLFEASPSVARNLSSASIAVYNGLDYDPWMAKLLGAAKSAKRQVIVVAALTHRPKGSNPHIWYDPATMPAYAQALAADLSTADPDHADDYKTRLQQFLDSLKPLQDRVADLRKRYAGTPVTATEPVFGEMAKALGLKMQNESFQLAVMNNTEPSVSDMLAMEGDLRLRKVKLLIYNGQATDTAAKRLLNIAYESKVPVIAVTETEPMGKDYSAWMLSQLDALDRALSGHK